MSCVVNYVHVEWETHPTAQTHICRSTNVNIFKVSWPVPGLVFTGWIKAERELWGDSAAQVFNPLKAQRTPRVVSRPAVSSGPTQRAASWQSPAFVVYTNVAFLHLFTKCDHTWKLSRGRIAYILGRNFTLRLSEQLPQSGPPRLVSTTTRWISVPSGRAVGCPESGERQKKQKAKMPR